MLGVLWAGLITETPSPSPSPAAGAQADIAVSDFWLAFCILVATLVVIGAALRFAYRYHRPLVSILDWSVHHGAIPQPENQVAYQDRTVVPRWTTEQDGAGSLTGSDHLSGPTVVVAGQEATFVLAEYSGSIAWSTTGSDPQTATTALFTTTFAAAGTYGLSAAVTAADGATTTYSADVTVAAEKPAALIAENVATPKPARTDPPSPSVVLPFVLRNWGRLVLLIFGVGVIGTLIALRVLDGGAGAGIIGTLLGVGAVSAGATPATPPSGQATGSQTPDTTTQTVL